MIGYCQNTLHQGIVQHASRYIQRAFYRLLHVSELVKSGVVFTPKEDFGSKKISKNFCR